MQGPGLRAARVTTCSHEDRWRSDPSPYSRRASRGMAFSLAPGVHSAYVLEPGSNPKLGSVLDTSPPVFRRGPGKMDLVTAGSAIGAPILDTCRDRQARTAGKPVSKETVAAK